MISSVILFLCLTLTYNVQALDNGVALTPPMGWMSWQRFRCLTDCELYPDDCISDQLFREMADRMAEDGYLEAGYDTIVIDDCWLAWERDEDGKLQPDYERFPYGMKSLADYIHSKGLKFGMYEDIGTNTCAGYPGIKGNLQLDANTFAEWEIDYIKIDGCYANVDEYKQGYTDFGRYLNETGRPIVYSCSWPAYLEIYRTPADYEYLAKICNLWRNWADIQDSYSSMTTISDWFARNQDRFAPYAGPGHWNDPDMLLLGNFGLSYEQSKSQMALWAIMAAPLLISVDYRTIDDKSREVLLNKEAIAINQDALGIQGKYITEISNVDIWTRPILPIVDGSHTYAVAFHSRREDGYIIAINVNLNDIGLPYENYIISDVFDPLTTHSVSKKDGNTYLLVRSRNRNNSVTMKFCWLVVTCITFLQSAECLNNGLALTPPMGWMSWQRFMCLTDCNLYPDDCISDKLFRQIADLMVSEGYLEAGYDYLIIDDCWLENDRDENNRLKPDRERFPYGMKNLSDYIHSKGLKFGLYQDYGTHTCEGYPGILGHLEIDANTFAEWGVDYTKIDGCNANESTYEEGYTEFGKYLNKTNRPMVYSCSWPAYLEMGDVHANYSYLAEICNLWRNWGDISDSYRSMTNIIDWFAKHQDRFIPYAGPGHWNDPDMLLIGNYGLSTDQSKSQMAIWAIMAAPLLMSVDLRTISSEHKDILLNKEIIALNQDVLGYQGYLLNRTSGIEIWVKPVGPVKNGILSYAVAYQSRRASGYPYAIAVRIGDLKLTHKYGYTVKNLFEPSFKERILKTDEQFIIRVNPSGVVLLKFTPIV
ncbi:hypothetical protein FQA39_LY08240 [Lamprigera yunnana]|nr:hypothetical protein FQA39_LY08240 [Lamprigera yunnana]